VRKWTRTKRKRRYGCPLLSVILSFTFSMYAGNVASTYLKDIGLDGQEIPFRWIWLRPICHLLLSWIEKREHNDRIYCIGKKSKGRICVFLQSILDLGPLSGSQDLVQG
jgi:hypothetical protein